jgi:tRNA U55 pseudouridine synthase TruB
MKTLERLTAAGYTIGEAHTLSEIEALEEKEREKLIIPTERIFSHLGRVDLSDFFSRLARCGVEIYLKKIGMDIEVGERVTLYDKKGFFAIGEVREFDTGKAIKPIRQFDV